ncbi:hypothetical protein [Sphingomonas sp. PAMC 26605]|uniref:hypothetical protein n=1 Tax=Sphingomonas sp. PAMC 26605 TaxID=1112214 RepID=UPI00026CA194|nr:hypothetical protein [Sphingomonas sp. PAMC 26605]
MLAALLSDAADLIFAVGVAYACYRGIKGNAFEARAARANDKGRREALLSDARLEYAHVSLQHPRILTVLMLAAVAKVVALGLKWS